MVYGHLGHGSAQFDQFRWRNELEQRARTTYELQRNAIESQFLAQKLKSFQEGSFALHNKMAESPAFTYGMQDNSMMCDPVKRMQLYEFHQRMNVASTSSNYIPTNSINSYYDGSNTSLVTPLPPSFFLGLQSRDTMPVDTSSSGVPMQSISSMQFPTTAPNMAYYPCQPAPGNMMFPLVQAQQDHVPVTSSSGKPLPELQSHSSFAAQATGASPSPFDDSMSWGNAVTDDAGRDASAVIYPIGTRAGVKITKSTPFVPCPKDESSKYDIVHGKSMQSTEGKTCTREGASTPWDHYLPEQLGLWSKDIMDWRKWKVRK